MCRTVEAIEWQGFRISPSLHHLLSEAWKALFQFQKTQIIALYATRLYPSGETKGSWVEPSGLFREDCGFSMAWFNRVDK